MFDWDDLRYFLAVAHSGSTLSAGKAERVSQTTLARRIATLESRLGVALFDRHASGYRLTSAGESLVPSAERVRTAVSTFTEEAASQSRNMTGTVRITVDEIYGVTLAGSDPSRPAFGPVRYSDRARPQ